MNTEKNNILTKQGQKGYSLTELLVTISLATLLMSAFIGQYSQAAGIKRDQEIRQLAEMQAQSILQTMGLELRTVGNGVPFDQDNFEIGESTLSDPTVTEPIVISSAATDFVAVRVNETGDVALVAQDFNPAVSLNLYLTDVSTLAVNDPVYISNRPVSGEEGMYGVIDAIDTGLSMITIAAGYVASPGASFDMGSSVEEVSTVSFDSPADGSGITRDSGFGTVVLSPNSEFSLRYLDITGAAVALPLTVTKLTDSVRAIEVTVIITSSKNLSDGSLYTAQATQVFGLRNLNVVY